MIRNYRDKTPKIHEDAFIAETADIIGNVEIGENANIWYSAVLRGDINRITVGRNTNVQDGAVVHADEGLETVIGENVTIGHNAIIHGCKIGNSCLIGMGAIVLNGAVIGENTIIGAGALVPQGKEIPSGSLVIGSPGKVIRNLTEDEIKLLEKSAKTYVELTKGYK